MPKWNKIKTNYLHVGRTGGLAGEGGTETPGIYFGGNVKGTGTGLEMSGTMTTGVVLDGAMTTGLLISGATTNAISITGASSTASINIAHTLAAAADIAIKIVSSSASTSGSTSQCYINCAHTMSGAGSVGGRAQFATTSGAIAHGAWTNALKCNFNYSAATGGTGLHSSLCVEMTAPDATVSGGYFAPLEIEYNIPASFVPQTDQMSMIYMSPNTTAATFDTYGTIFEIAGVTKGAGKVFDDCTAAAASHALKIRVNGTLYYMLLNSDVDA